MACASACRSPALNRNACFVVFDEFLVTANVGRDKQPALGHRFERLERGDEFGQAHGVARVGQD
jgi:hypothetical protein